MARPRSAEPGIRLVVYLPESQLKSLHAHLTPPGETTPPYGSVSKYISTLLQRDLARQRAITSLTLTP